MNILQPWNPVIFSVSFHPGVPSPFLASFWISLIVAYVTRYKPLKISINNFKTTFLSVLFYTNIHQFCHLRIIFNEKMYWKKP